MKRPRNNLNVFEGPRALRDFIDPDQNPPLPLVELPPRLNPFAKDRVRIFAKLMHFLPLGNVKSLPAYNMLREAEREGQLRDTHTLVESSSGNTVFSLAVIGRIFGIPRTKAIVSHEVTRGKLQLLRLFGTDVVVNQEPICPDPIDPESGIYKAKRLAERDGFFNPGQYDNAANPGAHEKWTGPQIWKQTGGDITVFCAGLGTTGTLVGAGKYLKRRAKNIALVGVARKPNNPIPGVRTPNLLTEISFDWRKDLDAMEEIGTKESFERSLDLCRAGLLVGPSSGFALTGLLNFLSAQKKNGRLRRLRNRHGSVYAVFICPDSPLPYLNEYFEYLDASDFPEIQNEHQLLHERGKPHISEAKERAVRTREITATELYHLAYRLPAKKLWDAVNAGKKISLNTNLVLLDLRSPEEFAHFHIPGSKSVSMMRTLANMNRLTKDYARKRVVFLCPMGIRSLSAADLAFKKGMDAFSLKGGLTEWSRMNLPRVRPELCVEFSRRRKV